MQQVAVVKQLEARGTREGFLGSHEIDTDRNATASSQNDYGEPPSDGSERAFLLCYMLVR